MNEMIEKVAMAICAADGESWGQIEEEGDELFSRATYRRFAQAAIKALREPSEAMIIARDIAMDTPCPDWDDLAIGWRAMIDAALKPGAVGP